jgi:putative endopeptidase
LLSNTTYLSTKIEEISFDFYGKFLTGVKTMKDLWKRSIHTTESQLGELIGNAYVKQYFSENAKNKVLQMIDYIRKTLESKILKLTWMGSETKKKALIKLQKMKVKIGYPDKWRVFTSDVRNEYSYLKNNLNCNIADNMFEFNKLYKPIDLTEFYMFPQMVNAYYSPSRNEIVFPAGILQPPFFSEKYDMALNFGAIGAVIGHEITHGFDDMGCKYDEDGNLNNWWTDEDLANYVSLTEKIKVQYDKCNVNGSLTLGENIADIGGVAIALSAFQSYLRENNIHTETQLERFFSAYATVWRSNCTKEYEDKQKLTDPHSPSELRVNCVLQNIKEFHKIYFVLPSHPMYHDIIEVW